MRLSDRVRRGAFWAVVWTILAFMTLPALVVFVTSLNEAPILSFPPRSLSLRWYAHAIGYRDFQEALANGLVITAFASSLALVVGTAFAYLLDRYRFPGKAALEAVLSSPLIVPHFTTGFGFLLLGANLGLTGSFAIVIAAHVTLVLPFVARSVYVSLKSLDSALERAAANLGASPARVFTKVTLPLLAPGMLGGWLIAAILSFTEFTASLYVTAFRTQNLPVAMYAYIRENTDPTIAAVSALLILATTALMLIANWLVGLDRMLNIGGHR